MAATDEILIGINLTPKMLGIDDTTFIQFITSKYVFFKRWLSNRYDREEYILEEVAILLTINFLNKLQTQLEKGVVLRSEYNTFDTNTLLLFDDTIKELLKRGAVLL